MIKESIIWLITLAVFSFLIIIAGVAAIFLFKIMMALPVVPIGFEK